MNLHHYNLYKYLNDLLLTFQSKWQVMRMVMKLMRFCRVRSHLHKNSIEQVNFFAEEEDMACEDEANYMI